MDSYWPATSGRVELAADEAHVWAVSLRRDAVQPEVLAILSSPERRRAEQFRLDAPRRQFMIARAVLRILLSRYLDVPASEILLTEGASGKPQLARHIQTTPLHFNVAHSDELALVAVTEGCEVGVDVERLRTVARFEEIARRYFHESEVRAISSLASSDRMTAFLKCWTAKEAVLKALGLGLIGSLASFPVPIEDSHGRWLQVPDENATSTKNVWIEPVAPQSEHVGAVATLGQQRHVRCFAFQC